MVNTFVFFLLRHKVLMYVQSDWQLLVSSSGSYSWDQSQSDIPYKCRSVYSGWNHFSHCFLVYESFVAHCIGHIDLQTSNPIILSVRPQVSSGLPLKCGCMRYFALSQFGCFGFCKIQSWWTDASYFSVHRHAMMCTETEGSHFKMNCISTNKIFRKVFFFRLSGNDKFINSWNWFNDGAWPL